MIGFIRAIFRRMSEVNSVAIIAQLVSLTAFKRSSQQTQSRGREKRRQPQGPTTWCKIDFAMKGT